MNVEGKKKDEEKEKKRKRRIEEKLNEEGEHGTKVDKGSVMGIL